MAEGFEWVFIVSYASLAFAGLMAAYEIYLMIKELRSGGRNHPFLQRPPSTRRVKMHAGARPRVPVDGGWRARRVGR
jgi:hypothetical protein